MAGVRFLDYLAGLPVDQAAQLPRRGSRLTTVRRALTLAVGGLVALATIACQPSPMPGTASRATGFPTGDPPTHELSADALDIDARREHPVYVIEGCFGQYDALIP
jgi:hypothetical protein